MRILANWGNRTMKFALMFCVATACLDSGTALSQEVPSVSAQHLRAEPQGSERGVCRRDGGPACDPGLVCLSAMCVFDDRKCGDVESRRGSLESSRGSSAPRLTPEIAVELITRRPGYSDGGLTCFYDQRANMQDGGRWTMQQSTLDDQDTRSCVNQLKSGGLLRVGQCYKDYGPGMAELGCFYREVSAAGEAKFEPDSGYLSFPCGKVVFGEIVSIRTLEGGRAATVRYTASIEYAGLSQYSDCTIKSDNGAAGVSTVERTFVLDDAGVWLIQE